MIIQAVALWTLPNVSGELPGPRSDALFLTGTWYAFEACHILLEAIDVACALAP